MANEITITKEYIGAYVHDAADIEKRIYTLEQAAKELEKNAECYSAQANELRHTKEEDVVFGRIQTPRNEKFSYYEGKPESYRKYRKDLRSTFGENPLSVNLLIGAITSTVLSYILIGIICFFTGPSHDLPHYLEILLDYMGIFIFAIVLITSFSIIAARKRKIRKDYDDYCRSIYKKNREERKEYEEKIKNQENYNIRIAAENKKYKEALVTKRAELDAQAQEIESQAQFFSTQAAETRKALEPLYEQKYQFYSVGIVPPDYRSLDCVYAFDQIFRNDLADTMREAVKIYEERVFRGEIIRGVRSLEQFMGNVSSLLTRLHNDMSSIKSEIDSMNKGVVRIYEQQSKLHDQNNELLGEAKRNYAALENKSGELFKETQMSRYALESLKENNDKLMKYIEE